MSLLMIGCGRMGQAMVTRWLKQDVLWKQLIIVKPSPLPEDIAQDKRIQWVRSLSDVNTQQIDYIILAVKPQMMREVLEEIRRHFAEHSPCAYVTIAAGLPIAVYREYLGEEAIIVRAMPNTPVMVGSGVTTLYTDLSLPASCHAQLHKVFEALGLATWLESESQMDAVTALAGSGPAYGYLFMQYLAEAAMQHGLSAELATRLAVQTMAGSAAMAKSQPEASLAELRQQVVSKGGTTEAALQQFQEKDKLKQLCENAITAAVERGKLLASG